MLYCISFEKFKELEDKKEIGLLVAIYEEKYLDNHMGIYRKAGAVPTVLPINVIQEEFSSISSKFNIDIII